MHKRENKKETKICFCDGACEQEFSDSFIKMLNKHLEFNKQSLFVVRNTENIKKIENLIRYEFSPYKLTFCVDQSAEIIYMYDSRGIIYKFVITSIDNENDLELSENYREIYIVGCYASVSDVIKDSFYPEGILNLKSNAGQKINLFNFL